MVQTKAIFSNLIANFLCIIFVLYFIYSSFNIIFDLQDSRTVVFLLLFQHDESA
jgi:hypothetical protein